MEEREQALRYNEGKCKWSLIDFKSLVPTVQVLEFGAKKYTVRDLEGNVTRDGAGQWKDGLNKKEVLESMMRHLAALMDGEENDPESGLPHAGHLGCNLMFYNYHARNGSFTPNKC